MNGRPRDTVSLVAGVAIVGLGIILLLDSLDGIVLSFAYLAPAVTATAGAVLVAHGVTRSRGR